MQHYFIHIGSGKTGTTSIQAFLNENRAALRENGVYYPTCDWGRIAHHHLIEAAEGKTLPAEAQEKAWSRLLREAKATGCPKVVISSERLATLAREENVRRVAELLRGERATIVYYVRRHDRHMQSAYLQELKTGVGLLTPDDFLKRPVRDYVEIINIWADVFGNENIVVFPFEKATLKPSLVETFLRCIGEAMHPVYTPPATRTNRHTATWPQP